MKRLSLYLNPFLLLEDASRGTKRVRERAYLHNRAARPLLVPYLQRWAMIAMVLLLCMKSVEPFAAREALFLIPEAASAVGCCLAVAVWTVIGAVYLRLGSSR